MNLTDVNKGIHKHRKPKRLGRGPGSGHGKTSGKGHKGQGQISGWKQSVTFESGASPIVRRIPKRGFNNQWARVVFSVNLGDIDKLFKAGEEVSPEAIQAKGLANGRFDFLKILSNGEVTKKLKFSAHKFSAQALEKIKKAGGDVTELPGPKPVVKNKQKSTQK